MGRKEARRGCLEGGGGGHRPKSSFGFSFFFFFSLAFNEVSCLWRARP